MKKTILLLGCTLLFASSVFAANLNVYASGLKVTGITDDKVSISYFLNAPADEVLFLLLDGANPNENSPVHSVSLSGKTAGANSAVIDLSGYVGSHYTWAIKATSNTANTEVTLVGGGSSSDRRFNFYTPAGLAVDNNPNSPYFGRIYVTESRENVKTTSGRQVQQGVYIYGADLSDVTGQGLNPYTGGVAWNKNVNVTSGEVPHTAYGPARITIDEEGYVYICDNGPVADGTSGVWRMNPANPSAGFKDVLADGNNSSRGDLYERINSAAVKKIDDKKYLFAIDNECENSSVARLLTIPLEVSPAIQKEQKKSMTLSYTYDGKNHNILSPYNTIVNGIYGDLWIFQYNNNNNSRPVIMHVNSNNEIDFKYTLYYCRRGAGAVSPDGNMLVFNGVYSGNRIRFFDISYDANKKPTLVESNMYIGGTGDNVDGIAFDVAGNLYFASATTQWFYAYALPKANNTHTTIAPNNQKISLSTPRMMAYDLRMDLLEGNLNFSFYANSKPLTGNIFIYSDKDMKKNVHTVALSNLNKGNNNVSLDMDILSQYVNGGDFYWAVQLTGEPITQFGEVYQSDILMTRGHAAIDNSPESEYFGRIYIANRKGNNDGEVYLIENRDYSVVYSGVLRNRNGEEVTLGSAARPAVDAEGFVYWADYGDANSGIQVMDPSTYTVSQFFQGSRDEKGVWINNSVAIGSSTPGVYVYGAGSDTKLYMVNEDKLDTHADHSYCVYNIGQGDGSILRTWGAAPSKTVAVTDNAGQNFSIVGTSHGAFLCQNRSFGMNKSDMYSLQFYDNNGVCKYQSNDNASIINGSLGAGMAVSADEKQLVMVDGNGDILLFNITWQVNDEPLLTFVRKYQTNFAAISTIHFDYAGNLVTMAGLGYASTGMTNDHRLVVYSQPTNENTIIVPAPSSQRIPALVLDEKRDNSTSLEEAAKYKQMNTVRVLRSLTAGMYNTLCLPFDASLTEGPLAGAKAYTFSSSSNTEGGDILLHFSEAATIKAGVPYLIEPQVDIDVPMDFMGVRITATDEEIAGEPDDNGISFNGILAPKTLAVNDKSILFLVSGNRLAWANADADMYGMRGYFSLPEGAYDQLRTSARIVTSESGTTDIQQTTTQANTQKIMQNGTLYIRKDGQIYTILGRKVK